MRKLLFRRFPGELQFMGMARLNLPGEEFIVPGSGWGLLLFYQAVKIQGDEGSGANNPYLVYHHSRQSGLLDTLTGQQSQSPDTALIMDLGSIIYMQPEPRSFLSRLFRNESGRLVLCTTQMELREYEPYQESFVSTSYTEERELFCEIEVDSLENFMSEIMKLEPGIRIGRE